MLQAQIDRCQQRFHLDRTKWASEKTGQAETALLRARTHYLRQKYVTPGGIRTDYQGMRQVVGRCDEKPLGELLGSGRVERFDARDRTIFLVGNLVQPGNKDARPRRQARQSFSRVF